MMKAEIGSESARQPLDLGDTNPAETGITLSGVWLVRSSFVDHGHATLLSGGTAAKAGATVEITPTANVWLHEESAAIVELSVKIAPTVDLTFEAEATFAALYTVAGSKPSVPIEDFAWNNGLANLVPYLRAKLAQLTLDSRFPVFYLQPLNLAALQAAAAGASELEES